MGYSAVNANTRSPSEIDNELSIVRGIAVVAKLAKSFGGAAIPKVLATFTTIKWDALGPNVTQREMSEG